MDNLRLLVGAGYVHADLSAYNLLWWHGQVWLIDFPQAVDVTTSLHAFEFLHRDVLSLDLSGAMLLQARVLRPEAVCVQADMRALPLASRSVAAVVAFYSLIHIHHTELPATLGEIHRVLSPGGGFALAVHMGTETVHRDEMLGEPVDIDFFLFDPEALATDVGRAGFTVDSVETREPYPGGVEAETMRAYIVASR